MNFAKIVRDESNEIEKTIASGELASVDKADWHSAIEFRASQFQTDGARIAAAYGQTTIARMP